MHINQLNLTYLHIISSTHINVNPKNDVVDTCNRNEMSKDLRRLASSQDTPYQLGNGNIFPHTAAANAETRLSYKQITY